MANAPVPPQNLDAEESVLGAMMISKNAIGAVVEVGLQASDFYRQSHGALFQAMLDLDADGQAVDVITVVDYCERQAATIDKGNLLDEIGGRDRITELAVLIPAASNAAHYARIVKEMAKLRGLIRVGADIQRLAWDRPDETSALIDRAEQMLFEVAADAAHGEVVYVRDVLTEQWRLMQELAARNGTLVGAPSGFKDLDSLTTGWQGGALIVVAARPSMGKTALAQQFGTNAGRAGIGTLIFSLEMSKRELAQRLISTESRVPGNHIRQGQLRPEDWQRMADGCKTLANLPLFIDESSQITVTEIRSKARRWKTKHPEIGLIIIDYLQLIDRQQRQGENDAAAVGRVSRALKILARELDVPVIVLSQLSRAVEQRADRRPILSDLRDSGAIEQDADIVLFIYRPEYYDPQDRPGEADLIVAKQRNGPTGEVTLHFLSRYSRFE